MENIKLVVQITIKEQYINEAFTFMKALRKLTNELDEGCLEYELYEVKDKSNQFYFIENWENQDALEKHKQKDHYKNFMEFMEGKFEDINATILNKYVED